MGRQSQASRELAEKGSLIDSGQRRFTLKWPVLSRGSSGRLTCWLKAVKVQRPGAKRQTWVKARCGDNCIITARGKLRQEDHDS